MTPSKKIGIAKTQLVINNPFWASLIYRLDEIEPRPDEWFAQRGLQPNICTNGRGVYYSEEFINGKTPRECEFYLAHEIGHCFLHHPTRQEWREQQMFNLAADGVLNPILAESGFEVPSDAYQDSELAGKSAEHAYAILDKRPKQKQSKGGKNGGGNGKGDGGGDLPQPPGSTYSDSKSSAERSHQEQEWNVAVQQAAMAAKQAGNLPASLERLIEEFKKPKIDWIAVLRRWFEETNPTDYQWFPVNRRYAAQGDFLPSIKKEGYGEIVIGVDTSGSIDQEMLRQFVSEVNAISDEIRPSKMHVIYCDTKVGRHDVFSQGEPLTIAAVGGGGTAFEPVFKYVEKHGIEPRCLIYLTDLEGPFPKQEAPYPTLWTTQSTTLTAPWGETLVMPVSE